MQNKCLVMNALCRQHVVRVNAYFVGNTLFVWTLTLSVTRYSCERLLCREHVVHVNAYLVGNSTTLDVIYLKQSWLYQWLVVVDIRPSREMMDYAWLRVTNELNSVCCGRWGQYAIDSLFSSSRIQMLMVHGISVYVLEKWLKVNNTLSVNLLDWIGR